jgi:hypothetical protein
MIRRGWSSRRCRTSLSVSNKLAAEPDREDQGHNNAQEHPRISGPFHFFARIWSRACRNFSSPSASRQNLSSSINGLPAAPKADRRGRGSVLPKCRAFARLFDG